MTTWPSSTNRSRTHVAGEGRYSEGTVRDGAIEIGSGRAVGPISESHGEIGARAVRSVRFQRSHSEIFASGFAAYGGEE